MNHHSAMSLLRTARSIDAGKPIDRNTRLMLRGTSVAVRLHNTDIVTYAENGTVTLNTGGWKTVTTKVRINDYSPFSVWSRKGCWFVNINGKEFVFSDGMSITALGEVCGAGIPTDEKEQAKSRKASKA